MAIALDCAAVLVLPLPLPFMRVRFVVQVEISGRVSAPVCCPERRREGEVRCAIYDGRTDRERYPKQEW